MQIAIEDPRTDDVAALVAAHVAYCTNLEEVAGCCALASDDLRTPDTTVFAVRDSGHLLGIGAVKVITEGHLEIKSMHTAAAARGRGVGTVTLQHILEFARTAGVTRISLLTGSHDGYSAARRLYERFGFAPTNPFGGQIPHPTAIFLSVDLDQSMRRD